MKFRVFYVLAFSLATAIVAPSGNDAQVIYNYPPNQTTTAAYPQYPAYPAYPAVASATASPYQANLRLIKPLEGIEENCSGSIIHKRWILTAARCLLGMASPNYLIITVGSHLYSGSDGTSLKAEAYIVYRGYVPNLPQNDITLIRLAADIAFSTHIQPIALDSNAHSSHADQVGKSTGWGRYQYKNLYPTSTLLTTKHTIISQQSCTQEFSVVQQQSTTSATDYTYYTNVLRDMSKLMCSAAHYQNGHYCNDESGSPLVIGSVQVGLVHIAASCHASSQPVTYTKVSSYHSWIVATLAKYNEYL